MAAEYILTLRVAPWWLACFKAALKDEDWKWAAWLARNPSVLILGEKERPVGIVGHENTAAPGGGDAGSGGARGA